VHACTAHPSDWATAYVEADLDRALLPLLSDASQKVAASAAAAFAALGACEKAQGKRVIAPVPLPITMRNPEVLGALARCMLARGHRGASLRYEAALALIALITTKKGQERVGQACLTRVCKLLAWSDMEGEQLVLLLLLTVLCSGHAPNQRAVVLSGALERVQQLMRHPVAQIQMNAVRCPSNHLAALKTTSLAVLLLHFSHLQRAGGAPCVAVLRGGGLSLKWPLEHQWPHIRLHVCRHVAAVSTLATVTPLPVRVYMCTRRVTALSRDDSDSHRFSRIVCVG
jgi:hypothetical protein